MGKLTTIPLGNKPYASPYYSIGIERCENMYLENAQSGDAKASYYLLKIPGLKRFTPINTTNGGGCRGFFVSTNNRVFCINGASFIELYKDGTTAIRGTLNSFVNVVNMCENGKQLLLVDGVNGWIFNYKTNEFTVIADSYFPGNAEDTKAPTHCAYLNLRFLVNDPNNNDYYWSNTAYSRDHDNTTTDYDPAQPEGYWTPLQTGKKVAQSDNISAIAQCNNQIWLFGLNSCEVHQDTGDYNGQEFKRIDGAIINIGCTAKYSIAAYNNTLLFLGSDKIGTLGVYSNDGLQIKKISTRGIEQILGTFSDYSDCIGFTYAQLGHIFYVMQFPTINRTLVYDLITDSWHERTFLNKQDGDTYAWRGQFAVQAFDNLLIGDRAYSAYYILDPEYYLNDDPGSATYNYIKCVKTSPINFANGVNVRYNSIQVICNQGCGLNTNTSSGVGLDPKVVVGYFDDTGIKLKNERMAPIGKIGEYTNRSRLCGLGMGRNRQWRITMSHPVPFILVGLIIDSEMCAF